MEIVTIAGIICGYALGSALVARGTLFACLLLAVLYALSAVATPRLGVHGVHASKRLGFHAAARILLNDSAARYSLLLTSVFWSAAAVLQFLMISWARSSLGLSLAQAAFLPALLALGIVAGALLAGAWRIKAMATSTGCAIALGIAITIMPLAHSVAAACGLMVLAGLLAGILLVPMNALLQQRGASILLPGLSVAVQNGMENGLSIIFLALYSTALAAGASINEAVVGLGIGVIVLVGIASWAMRHSFSLQPKEQHCSS